MQQRAYAHCTEQLMPIAMGTAWWLLQVVLHGVGRTHARVVRVLTRAALRPALAALYGKALATYDVKSATIDGDRAALAGLVHAHTEIFS